MLKFTEPQCNLLLGHEKSEGTFEQRALAETRIPSTQKVDDYPHKYQYTYSGLLQCDNCRKALAKFQYRFQSSAYRIKKSAFKDSLANPDSSSLPQSSVSVLIEEIGSQLLKVLLKLDKFYVCDKAMSLELALRGKDHKVVSPTLMLKKLDCLYCQKAIGYSLSADEKESVDKQQNITSLLFLKKKRTSLVDQLERKHLSKEELQKKIETINKVNAVGFDVQMTDAKQEAMKEKLQLLFKKLDGELKNLDTK